MAIIFTSVSLHSIGKRLWAAPEKFLTDKFEFKIA